MYVMDPVVADERIYVRIGLLIPEMDCKCKYLTCEIFHLPPFCTITSQFSCEPVFCQNLLSFYYPLRINAGLKQTFVLIKHHLIDI